MHKLVFLLILLGGSMIRLQAQDTLPNIKVKNLGGRIIISWKNNYGANIKNINIQRSFDSLKNYSTIGTVLNPQNKENGFADVKPPYSRMYYRVFVAFEGGSYIFSPVRRPVKDTLKATEAVDGDTVQITEPPVVVQKPAGYIASKRIFTTKDYTVAINLPEAGTKKYLVKFFDEEDNPVFDLTKITEPYLIIEKANFGHSGWFFFEVYENGVLVEKHKLYVPKDGKNPSMPYEVNKRNR